MSNRARLALAGIGVALLAFGVTSVRGRSRETRYLTATVDRGDVLEVVGATGTLQAVTTVQVGSQVSGIVQNLYADFNSQVKKGQVVARLDPSLFEARLGQARANLVSARANVERSRATVTDTRLKHDRAKELAAQDLVPVSDLDTAKANFDGAVAQLKSSEASVTQAEASVNQAQVDLDHTVISAPIDGVVINRSVDVGQTVAASFQAPVLFVIANDLTQMKVNASIDEADIGRVKVGQDVTFRVDAYPDRTFAGRVEQVRLQPTTSQNVVSYNTIVSAENPELRLLPGMTATVSVITRKAEGVLRIPAAALRFRPEGFDAARWAEQRRAEMQAQGGGERPPAEGGAPASPAGEGRRGMGGEPDAASAAGRAPGAGGQGGGMAGARGFGGPGGGMGGPGSGRAGRMGGGMRSAGIVFVANDKGQPEPKFVRLGVSDGQFNEVRDGLSEGAAVVTGIDTGAARPAAAQSTRPGGSPSANPFQPGRPEPRRRE